MTSRETSSVPVLICGKFASVATTVSAHLLPEVDVVHTCQSVETARIEIPSLLYGETIKPASGIGSNVTRSADDQRIPVVVMVGGAFSDEEFEAFREIEGVKKVPWIRADPTKKHPGGPPPHNPEYAKWTADRMKVTLKKYGIATDGCSLEDGAVLYY